MKKVLHFINSRWQILSAVLIGLFVISRLYIWVNKPPEFTEIIYSYMPYAHLWASGTRPYLDQWYEYPPATIPLFYLPHLIDSSTFGTPVHINYSNAYRGSLLIVDTLIFILIWQVLAKQKVRKEVTVIALLYYIITTAKANHFNYDTMDITFAGALALTVAAPIIWNTWQGKLGMWVGYWLGIALKLLNGPMGLIYAIADRKKWLESGILGTIAFAVIWGIPMVLYRSSLQVILVYHQIRGLQVDSVGAIVVRFIDSFTKSEKVIEVYKNYEIAGPITDSALKIINPIFIITLVVFIGYGSWLAFKAKEQQQNYLRLSLTLGYILLLMITSKVLSRPFMLWHLPLLAMYPFQRLKTQLMFVIPSILIVFLTLSPIPDFDVGIFRTALFVGIARSLLFMWLFGVWFWEQRRYLRG